MLWFVLQAMPGREAWLLLSILLVFQVAHVGGSSVDCQSIGLRISEVHLDAPIKDVVWLEDKVNSLVAKHMKHAPWTRILEREFSFSGKASCYCHDQKTTFLPPFWFRFVLTHSTSSRR
jgi:hypothetical protein